MHTLLNTNETDDILLIQELWFGPIGVGHKDFLKNGKEILGGASNPSWHLVYPHFTPDACAKVMMYVCIHDRDKVFKKNHLCTSARRDLCSHSCLLISDISTRSFTWRIINFYSNVLDPTALSTLLSLDIDPMIPTLLAGDFNAYGMTWYDTFDGPSLTATQCRSGTKIEAWALAQGLSLLSYSGTPTHKGRMDNGIASWILSGSTKSLGKKGPLATHHTLGKNPFTPKQLSNLRVTLPDGKWLGGMQNATLQLGMSKPPQRGQASTPTSPQMSH